MGHEAFLIELNTLAEKLGLANQIKFLGNVNRNDMPKVMSGFDLGYCGPTIINDGIQNSMYHSPLKIYEYLSMVKPVIDGSFRSITAVVKQDSTGFIFEPGNKNSLNTSILHALELQDKWTEMGIKGRNEIITDHSWENRVNLLLTKIYPYGSPHGTQ